jgi:hypothetical protein
VHLIQPKLVAPGKRLRDLTAPVKDVDQAAIFAQWYVRAVNLENGLVVVCESGECFKL